MKIQIGAGILALALALGGCGESGGNLSGAAAEGDAPLEQIPAPDGGDWTETVTRTDEGGILMGNPDAPVRLVEYASFTCPHCAAFSEEGVPELVNEYVRAGQVGFEFRNFIFGGPDAAATMLARCQPDSAFFRIADQLFAQQQQWLGNLEQEEAERIQAMPETQRIPALGRAMELDTFMARRGMPASRFEECLSDQQQMLALAEQTQNAVQEHNVSGTPSFLINGELVQNVSDWSQLEPRLRAALRQ